MPGIYIRDSIPLFIVSGPVLLESIRLEEGRCPLLKYHQRRVDRSRKFYYAKAPAFRLADVLADLPLPQEGVHKVRLLYGSGLLEYTVAPYTIRPVNSLRVVHADGLAYGRKYADRAAISNLYERRGICDDVLIVQRNHLTDTSYANVALFDGRKWYTPSWPLLPGARRAYLLERGVLTASIIRLRDLYQFESLRLVNSLMPWGESPTVRITAVLQD